MSKKVIEPVIIEQEKFWSLEISEDNGNVTIRNGNDPLHIEEASRTTVAKAICPEYQKVENERDLLQYTLDQARKFVGAKEGESIEDKFNEVKDQNAKLVEALGKIKSLQKYAIHTWEHDYGSLEPDDKDGHLFQSEDVIEIINQALQNIKKIEG